MFDGLLSDRLDSRPLGGSRLDGLGSAWTSRSMGWGGKLDRVKDVDYQGGIEVDETTINDLLRANPLGARIVEREISDALRSGRTITGSVHGIDLGPDDQRALEAWGERLGLEREIFRARRSARAHGLGVWALMADDGRSSMEPIDLVALHEIRWIRTYEPRDVQIHAWQEDPARRRYLEPEIYRLQNENGQSFLFHWSRVIRWEGRDPGRRWMRDHESRGWSVLDLVWSSLRAHGVTHQYAVESLQLLTQGVFESPNLADAILAGGEAQAKSRYEALRLSMGLLGDLALTPGEKYSVTTRPISGVKDVIDAVVSALVAATDMPRTILLGEQPGGLNAGADGELTAWYDHVLWSQRAHYTPPLVRLLELASRAALGPTCGCPIIDPGIEWSSLWQPTALEQAQIRGAHATARSTDLASGAVTPQEIRSDPTLAEWYDLGLGGLEVPDEAAMAAAAGAGDIEVADQQLIPEGETLITGRQAQELLGYRSTRSVIGFCKAHGAPVFMVGARYRFLRSGLLMALQESTVSDDTPGA